MKAKKAIQHPACFIFITARAGRKFLFSAALSDRAVHASYENAALRLTASAIHIFRGKTILSDILD